MMNAPVPASRGDPAAVPPESDPLAIRLVPRGEAVEVTWEADVLGRRVSDFRPPYDAAMLPLVIKALDAVQRPSHPVKGPQFGPEERDRLTARGYWAGDRVVADIHRRVGQELHAALVADPRGATALSTARDHATAQGRSLAYLLRLPPEATELAALPWELLWDDREPLLLSRGRLASCVRYLDLDQALPPPSWPGTTLRLLAIAPHAGIPEKVRQEERAARAAAWDELTRSGLVAMEEMSPATAGGLVDRIQAGPPVDILHVYGHGRYQDGRGALLFDAAGGGDAWLGADRLAALLGPARLIVLHACQSARVGSGGLLTGVAPALSAAGVPAVVAMQLAFRVAAATRFAGVVYRSLARGESVQDAVGRARQALYVEESDGASWYVPTLTIRARDTGPLRLRAQEVAVLGSPPDPPIRGVFAGVPAQGPPLVGRDATLVELRRRAAEGGKLVLHGLPGVGKSALALALAHDEATRTRFGGGVLWAGLGPQAQIDNILGLWEAAVTEGAGANPGGRPPRTAAERAEQLSASLRKVSGGRPFLVVLDDAWRPEDLLDFEPFAAPGSAVLLTTRDEALAAGYVEDPSRRVRVPELGDTAAIDLLARAAPGARAADLPGLNALAQAVGYLPLALVLMGRELAANDRQERWIHQAVGRLNSARERLALVEPSRRPGTAGVPLSLQAVVELSLDALPDDATRAAFTELGVFAPKPGDFSRAAALAVWQASEDVGDAYLRTLYWRGLLEITGQDRFSVHHVLAAVAGVRLTDAATMAARHFAYHVGFVEADREAWRAIAAELAQIQRAWDWAAQTPGQDRRVIQLAGAMRVFLERRGLRAQQRVWLERAVGAARALGDRAEEGRLLGSLGLCWWQLGEHRKAVECLEHALTVSRQAGDRQAEGRHLGSLGLVWASAMFRDLAIDYYEQALEIARELSDREGEGSHLGALGLALVEEGVARLARGEATKDDAAPYFRRAIACYEQALEFARAIDDRTAEGSHLGNLGNAWLLLGDAARAKDLLDQALTKLREKGERPNEGFHLVNLGDAERALGNLPAARRSWQEALAIYEAHGDPRAPMLRARLREIGGNS
jgi:tetratricopeptide (TPR) repeat protein